MDALRGLAEEVGVPHSRKKRDLPMAEFEELYALVVQACDLPQKRKAEAALSDFKGTDMVRLPLLNPGGGRGAGTVPAAVADVDGPVLNPAGIDGSVPAGAVVEDVGDDGGFRLRCSSCLFTYNNRRFGAADKERLWERFLAFLRSSAFITEWTATMEHSLRSKMQGRLHLHVFVEFVKAIDWTSVTKMAFDGGLPNASPTVARGRDQRAVIDQGHFYAWAWKVGTVCVATSGHEPWLDYAVRGHWLDDLWAQHKLDHEKYIEYAAASRIGFLTRLKQAQALQEREREARFEVEQRQVAGRLSKQQCQFNPDVVARLKPWISQYGNELPRYMFLVLRGVSRAGKSTLAKALGKRPFVQTVQSATAPDLKGFSRTTHDYILFDNVNSMDFVLASRALFQANVDVHTLAESRTGLYAYKVWLWRVPLVVTVDDSATWNPQEPWIQANCHDVYLDRPCYGAPASSEPGPS